MSYDRSLYDKNLLPLSNNNLGSYQETRPDSSELVDLHIYILPRNFWINKQKLAYNETIRESISAGFIRTLKHLTIAELRKEIRKQCASDEIPKEFVFLKSVGRAFTRIKPHQENELKVKNFLPPQNSGPEIVILEVYDQDLTNNFFKDNEYIQENDYYYNNNKQRNQSYDNNMLPDPYERYTQKLTPDDYYLESLNNRQNNMNQNKRNDYLNNNNYNGKLNDNYDRMRDFDKLKEEQERLRLRQLELENLRNKQAEQLKAKNQTNNQETNRAKNVSVEDQRTELPPKKYSDDKSVKNYDNLTSRRNENHANNEQINNRRYDMDLSDNRYENRNDKSRNMNNSYDKDYNDPNNTYTIENPTQIKNNNMNGSLTSLNNYNNNNNNNVKRDSIENISNKPLNSYRANYVDKNDLQQYENKKQNYNKYQNESNNAADPNQTQNTINNLRERLRQTRQKRFELESLRDELIKHLKQLHNRITLRRKEARDLWKKKYFTEKKKTPQLEEKTASLLNEIDALQKKMFTSLESDVKNTYNKDNDEKSNWLASLKLQEEIYLLKRQVDQSKLKLTTDIKLRNQAETETKALRTELIQTKTNVNQLKKE